MDIEKIMQDIRENYGLSVFDLKNSRFVPQSSFEDYLRGRFSEVERECEKEIHKDLIEFKKGVRPYAGIKGKWELSDVKTGEFIDKLISKYEPSND